jgi:N-acylglucosamine 2-epimerase
MGLPGQMIPRERAATLGEQYRASLFDDVVPWWMEHSLEADLKHGEWFGYLNRDGSRVWTAKANGWKGFFHLPRILYRCYRLFR